jgi:ribonuclease HIII
MINVSLLEENAKKIILSHSRLFQSNGCQVSEPQKGQYHFEAVVTQGKDKIKILVYFGKNGNKTVLQGNRDSSLFKTAEELTGGLKLFKEKSENSFREPDSYIGTDESGKGDYFGPLIIAGVFADSIKIKELQNLGVKDSKTLSDSRINILSEKIKGVVGTGYDLVVITPATYNKLYLSFKNVNKLLGWGHAKVLENILEKHDAKEAISDKFGDESFIINSLQLKGKNVLLHQETKAEKYMAVAAASIIARAKLNQWFAKKSAELNINLPKGASLLVEQTAVNIRKTLGEEAMRQLVKIHFKTTKRVISN